MNCNSPLLLLSFIAMTLAFCCLPVQSDDYDESLFARTLTHNPWKRHGHKGKEGEHDKFFYRQAGRWDPDGHGSIDERREMEKYSNLLQEPLAMLAKENVLGVDHWQLKGSKSAVVENRKETEDGENIDYFSIKVAQKTANQIDIRFENPVLKPIPIGGPVMFGFWARSPDRKLVTVAYELADNPPLDLTVPGNMPVNLTPRWRFYYCRFNVQLNSPAEHVIRFKLGLNPGTFELKKDICLVVVKSKSRKPLSPEGIADRIDVYRRGKLTVTLQDGKNNPLKNADVTISQIKHEFRFGCILTDFDPTSHSPLQTAESKEQYKTTIQHCCNSFKLECY